ncbi:MAG: ATP-dependent DNA helicase RecQ [Gemmatimonadetes bacterium]|jgi:ATP-dependent DNA helicase RecQ|nr:ATP-dependent DNA helicase RecQ [Gemmatimonadota bacterium]
MSHPAPAPLPDLDAALRRLGYDAFRPGQREAIETIINERRLLLVAPTGGGKSLIYQLPATVLEGTTLVVSPLVSLMHDQVAALTARGVNATFLAATLDSEEIRRRMSALARGEFQIAYVAPERLAFPGFRALVREINCPLVAIDEAHCISEWGHDFRPDYLQLGDLVADLADARVMACTATATPIVRDEILARLGLGADTPQLVRGFARPNLGLRVHEVRSGAENARVVDAALAEALGSPKAARGAAIVYAPTRKRTEEEEERLADEGWRTAAYHAGLSGDVRERAQQQFRDGDIDVIVATNAFGMGIDRADVRAVVHLAPPGSIEAYYQEVGRAGRDGADAIGVLCIAPGDLPLRRRLLEMPNELGEVDQARVQHRWSLFLELMRWAEGGSCRHDAILRYFGDEAETLAGCGRCDTCTALEEPNAADAEETAIAVRKALSAVARTHNRFGLQAAVKLLAGLPDPRLERSGLHETRTFGALRGRSEEWITALLRRCVTAGWVDFTGGDRPMVALTPAGKGVLFGTGPVRLLLPSDAPRRPAERTRGAAAGRGTRPRPEVSALSEEDAALFQALRARRLELARAEHVPPYVVASDRTLHEIAELRPRTLSALEGIYGIGAAKAARYGEALIDVVRDAVR